MPVSRLSEIVSLLSEVIKEEQLEEYRGKAYLAFQLGAGQGCQNFGEYLDKLGLSSDNSKGYKKEITKDEAIAIGEKIGELNRLKREAVKENKT